MIRSWTSAATAAGPLTRITRQMEGKCGEMRADWTKWVHPINLGGEPANTRRRNNVHLLLGQRRRRWPSNKSTLFHHLVFAGDGTQNPNPASQPLFVHLWGRWWCRRHECADALFISVYPRSNGVASVNFCPRPVHLWKTHATEI